MLPIYFKNKLLNLDRTQAPIHAINTTFDLNEPIYFQIDNGLKILLIKNHKLPIVNINLEFDRIPILEKEKSGLESIFGYIMRASTKNYNKEEIDNIIDQLGTTLDVSSSRIYLSTLKRHLNKSIEIMSEILLNPTFNNKKEFQRIQKQSLINLDLIDKDVSGISERVKKILLFGKNHPYGEYESYETINNLNIEDCKYFYEKYFIPNQAYLIFTGDISELEVKKIVEKYFSCWKMGKIIENKLNKIEISKQIEIFIVDMPHISQSNISIINPINFKKIFNDYHSAILANGILGGGIQSRLCLNLRENKGYTYGSYSILKSDKYLGYFFAFAQVKNEVTYEVINEFIKELNDITYNLVNDKELLIKKNEISGQFLLNLENINYLSKIILDIFIEKLPNNFYNKYLHNIQSVNINQILSSAKKYIPYKYYKILIVGKYNVFIKQLQKLKYPIYILDKYGNYI